ncbi:eukaryotic translation initiation factor 4E1-like [Aricia agestis]|uniref:eukaryotic translation initiation factor 4E1-like n=1 Tax=Aricia agestis TaxID=91739 RepID=UPI001C208F13|nr:eukaryotic translation initiation factor 4E1-like [Aricia agestis]
MVCEIEKNEQVFSSVNIPADIKHPLKTSWSFWMFTNTNKKDWEENLVKLTVFDTVEDYWRLYHWMKRPSELVFGQDYAVFRGDITPMWEHPANRRGGRMILNFEKKRNMQVDMDTAWMLVILMMIGENFDNSDAICGAVVNVRAKSKIGVWITDRNEAAIIEVGQKLKNQLGLTTKINFHLHNQVTNLLTI